MRDKDDRVPLLVHPLKDLHDLLRGLRVKIARRLVRHDDVRIVHEGAGNRDALPLSARKLVRQMRPTIREPHSSEHFLRPLRTFVPPNARIDKRQSDVVER